MLVSGEKRDGNASEFSGLLFFNLQLYAVLILYHMIAHLGVVGFCEFWNAHLLTSLNIYVGNFLLSIRPVSVSTTNTNENRDEDTSNDSSYEWSEDVKGAKAVRVSNLFEKFQYSFKRKLGGRNSDVSFGTGLF